MATPSRKPPTQIQNGLDALEETIAALESLNLPVPEPGSGGSYSGKFIQRVPKSLHAPPGSPRQAGRCEYEYSGKYFSGRKFG